MFQPLLETLALALDKKSIAYMLIGGQAVLLYGEPRLTQDVDVTLGIGPRQLDDLLSAIEPLGWQILVEDSPAFVKKTLVLPCMAQPWGIRVDFIFSYTPYEQQAIERARRVQVGHAQVCYASVEDLVIHKLVAGRARDVEDVRIMVVKNPEIDLVYLRGWLRQFEEALELPLGEQFEELWRVAQWRGD